MRPPITQFSVLQWSAANEIELIGYEHMKKQIELWEQDKVVRCKVMLAGLNVSCRPSRACDHTRLS